MNALDQYPLDDEFTVVVNGVLGLGNPYPLMGCKRVKKLQRAWQQRVELIRKQAALVPRKVPLYSWLVLGMGVFELP